MRVLDKGVINEHKAVRGTNLNFLQDKITQRKVEEYALLSLAVILSNNFPKFSYIKVKTFSIRNS